MTESTMTSDTYAARRAVGYWPGPPADTPSRLPLGDHPLGLFEGRLEVVLVVDVVHEDVLVGQIAIHAEPVGNVCESLVREGVFRVQVEDRTVAAALRAARRPEMCGGGGERGHEAWRVPALAP